MDAAIEAEHSPPEDTRHSSDTTHDNEPSSDNKFQKAIAAWRNIDLTTLIPTLDTAASDLVAHQRDSLVQRKDLAQKTKDFRKLDDGGKLGEVKGLLKAYQTYIDLLSNQSKAIHSAFLQAYTPLSEAPDPYPLLEASIDSLVTASETLPRLTDENQRLQEQVASLTSQLETTESHLQSERAARQELENDRDGKVKEVEERWEAVVAEKRDNWEAKERALEEKVGDQERLLKELKASYAVSQRLNKGGDDVNDAHAASTATAAELEIVTSELERTNLRLAEVEARNEQLRVEVAQAASGGTHSKATVEDDPAYLRLQSENSSLMRRVENGRFERETERRKVEADLRALEREVQSLKRDRDGLKEKMGKWSDYENLRRELEVLKSIEFSTGDDDDDDDNDDTNPPASSGATSTPQQESSTTKPESLEQLLLSRNKKLSNELTILRVSHQDLQSRLETLQTALNKTTDELSTSQKLTQTLEADLERVQEEASNAFPSSAMSVAGTYRSAYPHSSLRSSRAGGGGGGGGRNISPTSSIISGFTPSGTPEDILRSGQPVGGGSGMLPMITAQRDRYKRKNAELESQLQKLDSTISSLRGEIASLQRDNINLYEKTRYVSTYARGAGSGSAYASSAPHATAISIGNGDARESTDSRYKAAYETSLSPFASFRSRESSRALKRLSLPERAVFQITRLVLATRTSRNLFAGYCLGLHVLVLFMLYTMTGVSGIAGAGGVRDVMREVGARGGGGLAGEELNDAGII